MNAKAEHTAEVEQRMTELDRAFTRARLQLYAKRNQAEMVKRMDSDMMSAADKAWMREAIRAILEL